MNTTELPKPERSGHPSWLEVYTMTKESREETGATLKNMEERITHAISATEVRISDRVDGLRGEIRSVSERVSDLECWRIDSETARAVAAAEREARFWGPRATIDWIAAHWTFVVAVVAILVFLLVFLIDLRVDPQGAP
jgi:hypothetical protein